MADVLKLFVYIGVAAVLVYSRAYARSRAAVPWRVLRAVAVRHAGHAGDDLCQPPPDPVPRAGAAEAEPVRDGRAAARLGHRDRGGDEVLRARRAGLGDAAVRHVHGVRRDRQPGHCGCCAARRRRPGAERDPGVRPGVHRRRDRLQAGRSAVPHVGAGRLPGCADAGDRVHRLRAGAGRPGAHPAPGRGPGRTRPPGGVAGHAGDPGVAVDGGRQHHRHRTDQHQAHARLLDHRAHGFHAARHPRRHAERLWLGDVLCR